MEGSGTVDPERWASAAAMWLWRNARWKDRMSLMSWVRVASSWEEATWEVVRSRLSVPGFYKSKKYVEKV